MSEETSWQALKTDQGLQFQFKLSPSDAQEIQALFESHQWKTYKKILMSIKEGYVNSMLPLEEPNKVTKTLGIVVGLNHAINQLGVLVETLKTQRARSGGIANPGQPKA